MFALSLVFLCFLFLILALWLRLIGANVEDVLDTVYELFLLFRSFANVLDAVASGQIRSDDERS
jgi:hypothetical protein